MVKCLEKSFAEQEDKGSIPALSIFFSPCVYDGKEKKLNTS